MEEQAVRKAPLPWWLAGLFLGGVQILAVGLIDPLGVSTQFVVLDTMVVKQVAPEYVAGHPVISKDSYQHLGYGFWLDIGLILGAVVAAVIARRWRLSSTTVWWQINHDGKPAVARRLCYGFVGGFLILLGARFAHGCTSGQFASGWAQLSLSAIPFTLTLFGFGMLTAGIIYRKTPQISK